MRYLRLILIILSPLFIWQSPAVAGELRVDVHFSSHEASIIRDFYADSHVKDSHGKKSAKALPPGIAKNLRRGKPLPPGIAKQALPTDLLGRLPPPADGYERIMVSGKVLLVDIATQVIHDVLSDIIL
jgi:hypothetical protein